MESRQFVHIGLSCSPWREESLHPPFRFQGVQHLQRLLFVADLLQLARSVRFGEVFDHLVALGVLIAGLGTLFKIESQARFEPRGTNQESRIVEESVVGYQTQEARFDIRNAICGIH
jgi:hypothetical protein